MAGQAERMTGGEALVRSLYREGVRVVFGLPGVQLYGVLAALGLYSLRSAINTIKT